MIRRRSKPVSVLLWTVYLLLTIAGDGFGVEPCAVHGNENHAGTTHGPSHGHLGGAEHRGHEPDANAQQEGQSDVCTHVDGCPVVTAAIAVSEVPEFSAVTQPAPRPIHRPETARAPFPEFFLPYANAPPALV